MPKSTPDLPGQASPPAVFFTILIAWLIPGGGFLLHRRWARGLTLLIVLGATFLIGLILHGGIVMPPWSRSNEAFNLVNNLSFVIQLGAGLPALISLAASSIGADKLGWLAFLTAQPQNALYDLASFYLLVAGAMNYFAVCDTYRRLFAPPSPAEDEEAPAQAQDSGKPQ